MNSTAGSGGTSGSILVGVRNSYGISRAIMRFPTLSLDGVEASDIVSATIGLRDLMCQSSENITVECRIYDTTAPAWTESAPPSFGAANPYIGSQILDSYVVTLNGGTGGGNWYHFNILEAARAWANGTQDPSKGLVFKAADSFENQTTNKWYKTFSSYNRSSYKPSLKIVYGTRVSISPSSVNILSGEMVNLVIDTNATSLTWTSSNPSVATISYNGIVTGVASGEAVITANVTFEDGSTDTANCYVTVLSIPEGTYFLRNKQVGYYADIEGRTMANGTEIHQWTLNGNNSQKWIFEYVSDGYYTIKSANSTTPYYLGVKDDANTQNADIVLRSGTITDGMLWSVSVTDSGAYRLTPKTGDWALATNTSDQTNGVKLIQGAYVYNNSYRDEWEIFSFSMALYGIPDIDDPDGAHDHSSALHTIINTSDINTNNMVTYRLFTRDVSIAELKDGLSTESIYISRSHGKYAVYSNSTTTTRTGILLNDVTTTNPNEVRLWSHYGNGIASGSSYISDDENYSNISIALFVACYTGKDGEDGRNLPSRVVELGAEVAIGFKVKIGCGAANKWTKSFWEAMLNGDTVASAADKACRASGILRDDTTICGNVNYTLSIH